MRRQWFGALSLCLALLLGMGSLPARAQAGPPTDAKVIAGIHRLVLTDGSFQQIARYEIKGDRVRYISAERGGEWEEVPLALVDWKATERYAREHVPGAEQEAPAQSEAAAIDAEEQAERLRTPDVLPGLRLPNQDGIWALDYFHDEPELVALTQNSGDVNQQTGHNVMRGMLNPMGGTKQQVQLEGARAKVRLHSAQPAFYISLSTDEHEPASDALKVDTHGVAATQPNANSSPKSQYVIVRVQERKTYRVVTSVQLSMLGHMSQSQDAVPTLASVLPGGHWMKVTPKEPLPFGEYALMEVLSPGEVNLSAWDFAIDPQAPDNANAILPLQR